MNVCFPEKHFYLNTLIEFVEIKNNDESLQESLSQGEFSLKIKYEEIIVGHVMAITTKNDHVTLMYDA